MSNKENLGLHDPMLCDKCGGYFRWGEHGRICDCGEMTNEIDDLTKKLGAMIEQQRKESELEKFTEIEKLAEMTKVNKFDLTKINSSQVKEIKPIEVKMVDLDEKLSNIEFLLGELVYYNKKMLLQLQRL